MNILWLAWKDMKHPEAGGAEVVGDELRKRLVADGHTVTLLTARPKDMAEEDEINGYRIVRVGGKFSVYWKAYRYYKTHLKGKFDLIIDECNTMPFFARFYAGASSSSTSHLSPSTFHSSSSSPRVVLLVHQLAREIWFYQLPFPVSLVGYLLEPLYLHLLSSTFHPPFSSSSFHLPPSTFHSSSPSSTFNFPLSTFHSCIITVSESTKADLVSMGFSKESIHIISEGTVIPPVASLSDIEKFPDPTILSLGALRPMKRNLDILRAFEIAKQTIPNLKLIMIGSSEKGYGERVKSEAGKSRFKGDIMCEVRRYSDSEREKYMRRAHVFAVASVREGWGLVVTEANAEGTPAVVYDVPGLRDSVKDKQTGYVTQKNTPKALAECIIRMLSDKEAYERMRYQAWEWSKEITFEKQYQDFKNAVGIPL